MSCCWSLIHKLCDSNHKLYSPFITQLDLFCPQRRLKKKTARVWKIFTQQIKIRSLSSHCSYLIFHALLCCVPHAVLLSYTRPDPSPLSPPSLHTPPSPFVFIQVFGAQLLPPTTPTPTWLSFICHFFFSLPCFSPFLLSVSIGGHGLGKPTQRPQNIEELLWLFFLSCQHGG